MCNITVPVFDRLLEKDIFTIREAAWLTEGAYKYEEVVRMMGDIVATLHGQIRVCRKQQNSFGAIAEYINITLASQIQDCLNNPKSVEY